MKLEDLVVGETYKHKYYCSYEAQRHTNNYRYIGPLSDGTVICEVDHETKPFGQYDPKFLCKEKKKKKVKLYAWINKEAIEKFNNRLYAIRYTSNDNYKNLSYMRVPEKDFEIEVDDE